jgi:hypothetical protein
MGTDNNSYAVYYYSILWKHLGAPTARLVPAVLTEFPHRGHLTAAEKLPLLPPFCFLSEARTRGTLPLGQYCKPL